MKTTKNLKLPQYTGEDIFDLQDINKAYDSIDKAYGELDDARKEVVNIKDEIPKTNATAEVISARGGKETLGKRLDEFGSQLDNKAKQLESLEINVQFPPNKLEGLKCDGTDQYNKLQAIINYIRSTGSYKMGATLYFPRGEYSFSKIPMYSYINIKGDGKRNTVFKALESSETGLFYLSQAPVQFSNYEGFTVRGIQPLNSTQSGFKIHAQFLGKSAGGCWYCNFKNIEIRDFAKSCLEFSVESSSVSLANQFLYFEDVQGFRPNTLNSRCILGGGNQFNYKSCEFSNVTPNGIGTNIETEALATFDLLTCQNADYGFIYKGGSLSIINPWFENIKYSLTDKSNELNNANTVINLYGGNFANACSDGEGGGYLATTTSINTIINLFAPVVIGSYDKIYIDMNGTNFGINVYGIRKNDLYTSKKTKQIATLDNLQYTAHRNTLLLNANGIIQNINEEYQTGEVVIIKVLGSATLKTGGNIGVTKDIALSLGDSVTLVKADMSSKWWVSSIFRSADF